MEVISLMWKWVLLLEFSLIDCFAILVRMSVVNGITESVVRDLEMGVVRV